jgi:hypothetical protein
MSGLKVSGPVCDDRELPDHRDVDDEIESELSVASLCSSAGRQAGSSPQSQAHVDEAEG